MSINCHPISSERLFLSRFHLSILGALHVVYSRHDASNLLAALAYLRHGLDETIIHHGAFSSEHAGAHQTSLQLKCYLHRNYVRCVSQSPLRPPCASLARSLSDLLGPLWKEDSPCRSSGRVLAIQDVLPLGAASRRPGGPQLLPSRSGLDPPHRLCRRSRRWETPRVGRWRCISWVSNIAGRTSIDSGHRGSADSVELSDNDLEVLRPRRPARFQPKGELHVRCIY